MTQLSLSFIKPELEAARQEIARSRIDSAYKLIDAIADTERSADFNQEKK
jgi:hypothetical protein